MADESRWSVSWAERPVEEARIFNPAFCGELISCTVREFHRTRQAGLGLGVAFLVLPLVLHGPTREALPRRADKAYAGWAADHAPLLAELPNRARRLRPVSREALLFAVYHDFLAIIGDGLLPGAKPVGASVPLSATTDEVKATRSAARLLGRWFARQGTQASIFWGMGVAP